jgi:hypothetical protein
MYWKTSRLVGGAHAVGMLWLTGALLTILGGTAVAQSVASNSPMTLVGTWTIKVTPRDCVTGAPAGSTVNVLSTYHRGGTLTVSAGSLSFAPGQRTLGHGSWNVRGRSYSQQTIALLLFDTQPNLPGTPTFDPNKPLSPGFFAGWEITRHTVELTDKDHYAASGTIAFYKANGELYRTGCSTTTGQRFE